MRDVSQFVIYYAYKYSNYYNIFDGYIRLKLSYYFLMFVIACGMIMWNLCLFEFSIIFYE